MIVANIEHLVLYFSLARNYPLYDLLNLLPASSLNIHLLFQLFMAERMPAASILRLGNDMLSLFSRNIKSLLLFVVFEFRLHESLPMKKLFACFAYAFEHVPILYF